MLYMTFKEKSYVNYLKENGVVSYTKLLGGRSNPGHYHHELSRKLGFIPTFIIPMKSKKYVLEMLMRTAPMHPDSLIIFEADPKDVTSLGLLSWARHLENSEASPIGTVVIDPKKGNLAKEYIIGNIRGYKEIVDFNASKYWEFIFSKELDDTLNKYFPKEERWYLDDTLNLPLNLRMQLGKFLAALRNEPYNITESDIEIYCDIVKRKCIKSRNKIKNKSIKGEV